MSLYSLYIGRNNPIFYNQNLSIFERYLRIPTGLYYLLTQKIGFLCLISFIVINIFIVIRYFKNAKTQKILSLFKWIGLFALLYILLLPLGGYKNYRPFIIRYDTFMPITIGLFFMYGITTYYLIRNIPRKSIKYLYVFFVILFSSIFTFADEPEFNKNHYEKIALEKISQSTEKIVVIESNCTVLSWEKITDPKESELNGQLLEIWRITKDKKLYYQKYNAPK